MCVECFQFDLFVMENVICVSDFGLFDSNRIMNLIVDSASLFYLGSSDIIIFYGLVYSAK